MADGTKTVVDISKPGTTPPDASGKPVIVSHKPMIKDPMINDEASAETDVPKDDKQSAPLIRENNKVIEPLSKPGDKPVESVKEEAAIVEAVIDQKGSKKKTTKSLQDTQEKNDQLEKLVESKKYFVKIRIPKQKRNKRVLVIVVFVILASLLSFGLAADAKIIPVSVPFDFIKIEKSVGDTMVRTQPLSDSTTTKEDNMKSTDNKGADVSGPVSVSGDMKRQTDIQLIQNELETYFTKQVSPVGYPTLEQMNDTNFVTTNLANIASQKVQDPEAKDGLFANTPAAKIYSYQVTTASGEACDNVNIVCTKYTLTATLSDGTIYTKTSIVTSDTPTEQ